MTTNRKAQNDLNEVQALTLPQQHSLPILSQDMGPFTAVFYKINVDKSFDFQSSRFKAAFLIRNSSNSLLDGNCCEGVASSSLAVEGFALYQDILFPISRNFLPVMVESDSFQLIAVVGGSFIAIL